MPFFTEDGVEVPAVTAAQMREVDRLAEEAFGLGVLQMMENAGRALAHHARQMLPEGSGEIVVLAGPGGNGGGGLCAARHLLNRGLAVSVVLSHPPEDLRGPAARQWQVLARAGLQPTPPDEAEGALARAALAVDALLGYSLRGAPRGRIADLIEACNARARRVLSLDLPSGLDATSGQCPGVSVRAHRLLTLALPKTGLLRWQGDLYLADIGIPPALYRELGLEVPPLFGRGDWVRLVARP